MQDDFRAAAIKEVRRLTYYFALGANPRNRFALQIVKSSVERYSFLTQCGNQPLQRWKRERGASREQRIRKREDGEENSEEEGRQREGGGTDKNITDAGRLEKIRRRLEKSDGD